MAIMGGLKVLIRQGLDYDHGSQLLKLESGQGTERPGTEGSSVWY